MWGSPASPASLPKLLPLHAHLTRMRPDRSASNLRITSIALGFLEAS